MGWAWDGLRRHGVHYRRAIVSTPPASTKPLRAGAIEEWTITNTSPMDHPFHLHVWPMQVLSIAGVTTDAPTWQNVVNVPARGSTVVRIAVRRLHRPHRLPLPHPRPRGQRHDGRHRSRLTSGAKPLSLLPGNAIGSIRGQWRMERAGKKRRAWIVVEAVVRRPGGLLSEV